MTQPFGGSRIVRDTYLQPRKWVSQPFSIFPILQTVFRRRFSGTRRRVDYQNQLPEGAGDGKSMVHSSDSEPALGDIGGERSITS